MKHGNALRRGLALVLSAAMAVSSAFAADWNPEVSKEADGLASDYTAKVTLSLPSNQEELVSDVVFVIDESSCTEPVKEAVAGMLNDLYDQVKQTGATIKVGAIQFRGAVNELPLTELTDESADTIRGFLSERPETPGTNMHVGLLAAADMLENDTSVADSRKYLILVGDGITYTWDEEGENTGINFSNDDTVNTPMLAGPDAWDVWHGYNEHYIPDNWDTYLDNVGSKLEVSIAKSSKYEREVDISADPFVKADETENYASTVDIALYKSREVYKALEAKYQTYVVATGVAGEIANFPFGISFMKYLSNGEEVTFEDIQKEIYYFVDKGSKVIDVMGHGTDSTGTAYDFDFVNDLSTMTLSVGGKTLEGTEISGKENTYGFGTAVGDVYPYVVTYTPGEAGTEKIEIAFNVPVTNFDRVQFSYQVKLTNPVEDGQAHNDLGTNEIATLIAVGTDGDQITVEFPEPKVSYLNGGGTVDPDPEPDPDPTPDPDRPSGGGDNDRYEGPDLTVVKVDEDGGTIESNARFRIYKEQGSKTMWYKGNQSWSEDEEDAWIFNTSVGDGSFTAYDLKPGTYYIVEISAPEGYDLAEEPLEVEVESRDVTVEFVNSGDGVVTTPTKPVPDTGR